MQANLGVDDVALQSTSICSDSAVTAFTMICRSGSYSHSLARNLVL